MAPTASELRPPLCEAGHALVVTAHFPPRATAASTVMGNLLGAFDPTSYTVLTCVPPEATQTDEVPEAEVVEVQATFGRSTRVDKLWRDLQAPVGVRRIVREARRRGARVLVGVYPDYHFIRLARAAARRAGLPWVAYLHDALGANMQHTRYASEAMEVERGVLEEASTVFVMSRGMEHLYRERYGVEVIPLEHTYPEPIPEQSSDEEPERQALWSGQIYEINRQSMLRVHEALGRIGCPLVVTTPKPKKHLEEQGFTGEHVRTAFFPSRSDYLDALRRQALLLVTVDWPDESVVHPDELFTIFPTKIPEYLAAGRPILAHCPEEYPFARFIRERGCGIVVSERSVDALTGAVERLLRGGAEVDRMCAAALDAAQFFSPTRIAHRFQDGVRAARVAPEVPQ